MYNWRNVAERVEKVYDGLPNSTDSFVDRLKRAGGFGPIAGLLGVIIVALDFLVFVLICCWLPKEDIERAPDFPQEKYKANKRMHFDS